MSNVGTYAIELDWKAFNVDLNTIQTWMKANAGEAYSGNCAKQKLQLWFLEEPTQDVKDAINAYWESLDETSIEATNYKSDDDREAEKAAATATAKASAQTKLAALGLSTEEIAAILG